MKNQRQTERQRIITTTMRSESGAVLIVVLLVLILILIVGAVAVRQSTTDLRVATAGQVNQLLFQANDAAFMKVEKEDRILSANREDIDVLKGYMSNTERAGHEVSLCVRPRSTRLFSILEISERNENGDLLASRSNGYCNPSDSNDYVSEGRVITQLSFVRPDDSGSEGAFVREVAGTYSGDFTKPETGGNATIGCTKFEGYATSVIPAFSDVPLGDADSAATDTSTIAGCFKQPRTGTATVDTCLAALGVPFQTHQQQYVNQPVGVECISGS